MSILSSMKNLPPGAAIFSLDSYPLSILLLDFLCILLRVTRRKHSHATRISTQSYNIKCPRALKFNGRGKLIIKKEGKAAPAPLLYTRLPLLALRIPSYLVLHGVCRCSECRVSFGPWRRGPPLFRAVGDFSSRAGSRLSAESIHLGPLKTGMTDAKLLQSPFGICTEANSSRYS